jgi:hypothetical protein
VPMSGLHPRACRGRRRLRAGTWDDLNEVAYAVQQAPPGTANPTTGRPTGDWRSGWGDPRPGRGAPGRTRSSRASPIVRCSTRR